MTVLVTGGAGFIGSNFVLDWLAASRRAGRQPRRADLRRQPARTWQPLAGRSRATSSCRATSATARCSTACSPSTGRARWCTSRPRAMSTAASTARRPSCGPTSKAPSRCWRRRARTGPACQRRERERFRFLHVSTDEVYGSLGPTRRAFTEDPPLRAQQPLLGQQGGERPPGARLAPHLRPAGADHQLLQQLRALSVSRRS